MKVVEVRYAQLGLRGTSNEANSEVIVEGDEGLRAYELAPDAEITKEGTLSGPRSLMPGDDIQIVGNPHTVIRKATVTKGAPVPPKAPVTETTESTTTRVVPVEKEPVKYVPGLPVAENVAVVRSPDREYVEIDNDGNPVDHEEVHEEYEEAGVKKTRKSLRPKARGKKVAAKARK